MATITAPVVTQSSPPPLTEVRTHCPDCGNVKGKPVGCHHDFHSASQAVVSEKLIVRNIALESLRESKSNPRKTRTPEADAELAASVAKSGVLQPVLVRALPGKDGDAGLYELVAGSRRFRAAQSAKLKTIPARILELSDEQALEVQIIENLQREDVSALEEGRGYRELIEMRMKGGLPKNAEGSRHTVIAAIAREVGKSVRYVYTRMKLAELLPGIQEALADGKIAASHADLMVMLQPAQQKQALEYVLRDFRQHGVATSIREFKRWVESEIHHDLSAAPWKKDDATLVKEAGACWGTCPKRTAANPALHPEVKAGKDFCLDPDCYEAKRRAFVSVQQLQLAGAHVAALNKDGDAAKARALAAKIKVAKISPKESYSSQLEGKQADGVLFTSSSSYNKQFVLLKRVDDCRYAQPAVVVEGPETGHGRTICANENCEVHWRKGRGSSSSQPKGYVDPYRKKQLAQEKARRLELKARGLALREAVSKLKTHGDSDLRVMALDYFDLLGHDRQKTLCEALEWQPPKPEYGQFAYKPLVKKKVAEMNGGQLMTFLQACSASVDTWFWAGQSTTPALKYLDQLCKRSKTDIGKIRAELKAAAEKKSKPKTKAAAPKTAKKKGGKR